MNIFRDYEGILGKPETAHLNNTFAEFINLSLEVKHKLGKQGYLLDKYLSLLLGVASKLSCTETANSGFMSMAEFYCLCYDISAGREVLTDNSLYEKVKKHIEKIGLSFQEETTRLNFLLVELCSDFMAHAVQEHFETEKQKIASVLDIVCLRDLYRDICTILGEESIMEKLNLLIRQRFFLIPSIIAFEQGMTDDLLRCLTYRDDETNKQVFQLFIDRQEIMQK